MPKPKPLLDSTYELLDKSSAPLTQVAASAGVGVEWLKKFKARAVPNPTVTRVQKLHDYLSARV